MNVFVRLRPIKKKNGPDRATKEVSSKTIRTSVTRKNEKSFTYDTVFGESASQVDVYNVIGRPVIDDVLKGYNGCIMAYGQTGAGKTHSLLNMSSGGEGATSDPGLVPRIVTDLYIAMAADYLGMFTVSVAMCQIYNEQIDDLLKPKNTNLKLVKSQDGNKAGQEGWEVENISWYKCKTPEYLLSVISNGRRRLVYAETEMNKHSSRSHAVLMIKVARHKRSDVVTRGPDGNSADAVEETEAKNQSNVLITGKQGILNVIDLAGSERVKKSKSSGLRFKEATNINTSLLVLGQCVQALAFRNKHVPYRESVLTKFLEPSLSGSSRVNLLVCVAPEREHAAESSSSLEFAYRAMSVPCSPKVNEMTVCMQPEELIADLASTSMIKLEQSEALQKITEENMRIEEEVVELRRERDLLLDQSTKLADGADTLKSALDKSNTKMKTMEEQTIKVTAEALKLKQDLLSEKKDAKILKEKAHEEQVRLCRENDMLRKQLESAEKEIGKLKRELLDQQNQLKDYLEGIHWIEASLSDAQGGAHDIEDNMESMVSIMNQCNVKIDGLEEALVEARTKAHALGETSQLNKSKWNKEKSILHALIHNIQSKLEAIEEEGRKARLHACCAGLSEDIMWNALSIVSEREWDKQRKEMVGKLDIKLPSKSDEEPRQLEWLKVGIPVIKWGRNNRPYERLLRLSKDTMHLEWLPLAISKQKNPRSFPLIQIKQVKIDLDDNDQNTEKAKSDVQSVWIEFAERTVRMNVNSSEALIWFRALKGEVLRSVDRRLSMT